MSTRSILRFDTVVAVCALFTSTVAAAAMVYQTHVIEEQFAATVWPYLNVETNNFTNEYSIVLTNDGAGPALIRSAQLAVDGKAVSGWSDYYGPLLRTTKPLRRGSMTISAGSLDGSESIRAGDSRRLFLLHTDARSLLARAHERRLTITLCYCSINGRCWRLADKVDTNSEHAPESVGACSSGPVITAGRP